MLSTSCQYEGTHQEHNRRTTDQSHGGGEFAHVPSTVASSCLIHVLHQTKLTDPPVSHLRTKTEHEREREKKRFEG